MSIKLSDKAQASMQKVIARFEQGDLSSITKLARIPRQEGDTMPSLAWSLANRVLAYAQSDQLDCRGFRQWEQVGRKVRKGGRGVFILAPKTIRVEEQDGEIGSRVVGFTSLAVFPLSETEGDDVPVCDYAPAELPPLFDVATRLGVKVEYQSMEEEGHLGFYAPKHEAIILGTHDRSVFWHELAHAAHARVDPDFRKRSPEDKETVAEFTACVLADLYGENQTGKAWHYISRFADDPLTAIARAVATVEPILALILESAGEPAFA